MASGVSDWVEASRQFKNISPALKTLAKRYFSGVYHQNRRSAEPRNHDTRGPIIRSIGTPQTFLSTRQVDDLVAMYQRGDKVQDIAYHFGIHRKTALAHLKRRSVQLRNRGLTTEQKVQAVRLYQEGLSLRRISRQFGAGDDTIRRAVVAAGERIRPRGGRT